jgi:hypothetical protein
MVARSNRTAWSRGRRYGGDPRCVGRGIAAAFGEADFALSESPRYAGRAIVALASDPDRTRWNQKSVSSSQLAREYGFTDLDGSRPDIWRYFGEIRERGLHANPNDYR